MLFDKIKLHPHPGATRKKRGLVLVTTLFFMILFFMLSFAFYQLTPSETKTALRDKTLTEAHFGCTAGIRLAKEWISAVAKPDSNLNNIEGLGDNFPGAGGSVSVGGTTFIRAHNDIFSVPNTDPNFNLIALGSLTCPQGRFKDQLGMPLTGVDLLGLRADANLTLADYNSMKAQQNDWPCLKSPQPLELGSYQIYTYIVPSATTLEILKGASAGSLRTYLVTSVAYRSGLPVLRARCILKEQSSADYAYRSNINGLDPLGKPIPWNVQNANTVLFDGPVHTNQVPWLQVPLSYWNSSLTYFAGDTAFARPKRAIMGSLTFSGTNTSISPNFDGVGYIGGNYDGTTDDKRPFNSAGTPIASTAQGGFPNPAGGPILNRYDRMIEGGRQAIRKVATVPLPADLNALKAGAWGSDSDTGLDTSGSNPALWPVDSTQYNGVLQAPTAARPAYTNSSGNLVPTSVKNNAPSKDAGIFINPVAGTMDAAGGVVIKGDTRNMYLEVTDSNGNLVTNVASLEAGSAVGNPTVRIQSTIDSYDTNSGTNITTYVQSGTSGGTYVPTVNGYFQPTQNAVYHPTVNGVWTPTVNAYWQPGSGLQHNPGTSCPTPLYTPPSGGGSGTGTYTCVHPNPGYTVPTVNGYWSSPTVPAYTSPTVPGYTVPTVNGYTIAGTAQYTAAGYVQDPFAYKAQDWVVDVKNTSTTIPASIPIPTGSTAQAWRTGVGGEIQPGDGNTKQAQFLGDTPGPASQKGITSVYVHTSNGDTAGSLVTAPITVPTGKIVVYKQSRSDANRMDVFILNRPPSKPVSAQPGGLNGAVFSTGDINALRGVNMEAKTIGADYTNYKGISIMDNVWQYGTQRGAKPLNAYHGLGLVAPKMNVQTRETRFLNKSLYLYATIIAGKTGVTATSGSYPTLAGGLDVSNSNGDTTTNWGRVAASTDTNATQRTLQIIGGLTEQITKARLAGTTGGTRGFNQQMNFDQQLAHRPPPFFPSTNLLVPMGYTQDSVMGK